MIQNLNKEQWIVICFFWLFFIVVLRLIQLQIVDNDAYEKKLIAQHFQHVNIKAKRWNIFAESPSWQPIQLTANTEVFDLFVDPRFVLDKDKLITELIPILIEHLCPEGSGSVFLDPYSCLLNVENYTDKILLPKKPQLFYLWSGVSGLTWLVNIPTSSTWRDDLKKQSYGLEQNYNSWLIQYNETLAKTLSGVYYGMVKWLIQEKLQNDVYRGKKKKNFLVSLDSPELKDDLQALNLPYVTIDWGFAYVTPMTNQTDINAAWSILYKVLSKHQIIFSYKQLKNILTPQENKYVKIANGMNQQLVNKLKERQEYRKSRKQDELYEKRKQKISYSQDEMIPLMHWLWFEQRTVRTYPSGRFLSHVLWYVTKDNKAISGIEEYRDEILKWKDGQKIWFWWSWLGQAWSDNLQLSNPTNGANIVLTIEPNIQKKVEEMTQFYVKDFRADSVSILVMNPYNGAVVASANAPDFDPNNTDSIYKTQALWPEFRAIIDDPQFLDIPVYIQTGGKMLPATLAQRTDTQIVKYMNTNYYGPLSLIDKTISLAYEPGSIFKPITVSIGLDADEIELYDMYYDKWEIQVWDYYMRNVSKSCLGTNTILHALQFSCNIGMVHVIQKIGQYVFYNYLEKFWFGKPTWIELAGEVAWSIPDAQNKQKSRFFNNSFGQGLLVTPMQMWVAFSALVNGGSIIKPTIIKRIEYADGTVKQANSRTKQLIFKEGTSELIKNALFEVVNGWQIKKFAIAWKTLAGKTGTSQIPFRGKYQNGVWRTNGSFAWIITRDNTKYVIIIQVRRPRTNQRWELTAWAIYGKLAKFLVEYEDIEK